MNVFTFVILVVIIGCTYEIIKKGMDRRDRQHPTEDTELMQQLNRSTARMEQRIEALETILMDRIDQKNDSNPEHLSAPHTRTTN